MSQQNPWGYVDLPRLAHFDFPSQREKREAMTQEGSPLEFSILIPWRGGGPWHQWWNYEFIWKEEQFSSLQERLQGLPCSIWLRFIKVLTVSCPNQFQLKVTRAPVIERKNCQQEEKTTSMPSAGGILLAHFFPRGCTHQTPACILLWWWITEDKTKQCYVRPNVSTPVPPVSPPHSPPPYLGHFVHRDWNSIDSERRSSELTSCGAGACSARADSRSSRIMLLYLRTCRELRAEVNKMPNNQGGC